MSLVPFSSPARSTPPATAPRPAMSSQKLPAPSAGPRTHAMARADSSPTPGAKGRAGFASVLAAVQEQKEPDTPLPEASPSHASTRAARADAEVDTGQRADATTAVVVTAPVEPAAIPQTPWLLLALGHGSHSWQDVGQAGTADGAGANEGGSPANQGGPDAVAPLQLALVTPPPAESGSVLAPGAGHALALTGAIDGSGNEVARSVTAMLGSPQAGGPVAEGASDELSEIAAAAAFDAALGESGSGETLTPPAVGRGARPEAPVTAAREAAEGAAATLSPQALEVTARWRAATRGAGGDVSDSPVPGVEIAVDLPAAGPPGASAAAHRLAQMLAHSASPADAPSPSVSAETAGAFGATPTEGQGGSQPSRASDVLLRLAQAGAGPRGAAEPSPGAAYGQLFAATQVLSPLVDGGAQPSMASPSLPQPVGDQVMQQVVSSLRMQWKDGIGEARLHLRPDALGAVTVTLKVEAGAVTAVIRADSPQVQEWVLQHQQTLRQQLEAAGLRLDDLVVSPDDQRQQERGDSAPEQRRRPRAAAAATRADTPRFEQLL